MYAFHEGGGIPVVDPTTADGVFSLLWLVIALPLAGAAILLIGGRHTDRWGHLLATALPLGSFAIALTMFVSVLGREEDDRQVVQHLYTWFETGHLDVTSLASLTAGNVAATGGISKLLAEKEFTSQYHEGEKTHVHISLVHQRAILVVLFDERSSLGLVRLRVKKAGDELGRIFEVVNKKAQNRQSPSIFNEITDDDIDNLFSD